MRTQATPLKLRHDQFHEIDKAPRLVDGCEVKAVDISICQSLVAVDVHQLFLSS